MVRSWPGSSRFALVGVVLACVLVFGVLTPTTTAAVSPSVNSTPTRLDSCTRITHSGHYVLTHDVETRRQACLRIDANDVTLDGAGHVVDGRVFRENTTGIGVAGRNVTVRNVTAINWTFGVRYENAGHGTVANVTTWRTGDGISILRSPKTHIERVTATNGFTGIAVSNSDDSRVRNSTVRDTSSSGVFVSDSSRVAVTNTSVARSTVGIALAGNRGGAITETVVRSTEDGILLVDSHGNTIRDTTLTNPHGSAVVTRSNASDNRIVATHGNWTIRDVSGPHTRKTETERP